MKEEDFEKLRQYVQREENEEDPNTHTQIVIDLLFSDVLEKDAMFSEITFPSSIWPITKDINFSLQAKITTNK